MDFIYVIEIWYLFIALDTISGSMQYAAEHFDVDYLESFQQIIS